MTYQDDEDEKDVEGNDIEGKDGDDDDVLKQEILDMFGMHTDQVTGKEK